MTVASGRLVGAHAGIWGFDWSNSKAQRVISSVANIGYDLLEIPSAAGAASDTSLVRRFLEQHHVQPTVSLALDFEGDVTSPDPAIVARGERRLVEAITFARDLGSNFVGGVIYSAMGRYLSPPSIRERSQSLDVLRRVAAVAEKYSINLGIEFVNRYESNLLNNVEATLSFLGELDVENAVLHFDTFHAHIEEPDLASAISQAGQSLGYIHASESHRGILGTGSIPWLDFMSTLEIERNRSPIVVETFSAAIISSKEAVDIALWATMWEDPDEVAALSQNFLTSVLTQAERASPGSSIHHTQTASAIHEQP